MFAAMLIPWDTSTKLEDCGHSSWSNSVVVGEYISCGGQGSWVMSLFSRCGTHLVLELKVCQGRYPRPQIA